MATQVSLRNVWASLALLFIVGIGIVANPFIYSEAAVADGVLSGLFIGSMLLIGADLIASRRSQQDEKSASSGQTAPPRLDQMQTLVAFVLIVLWWAWIERDRWQGMRIYSDDSGHLGRAVDWQTTMRFLFIPHNEHFVVPQRFLSWMVVRCGDFIGLGNAMQWLGAALFLIALFILFRLALARFGNVFLALVTAIVFAFAGSYDEALDWYSASLWLATIDLLLLALWGAEEWLHDGGLIRIAGAYVMASLAPFSFSLGLLVGPLTSIWIASGVGPAPSAWDRFKRLAGIAAPTIATILGVAFVLPRLLVWLASDEYLAQSGFDHLRRFDPLGGLAMLPRFIVDSFVVRNLGGRFLLPWWLTATAFATLVLALHRVLRRRRDAWQTLAPLGMIVIPYLIVLPFRTSLPYITLADWNRYNLIPQIGAAFLMAWLMQKTAIARGSESNAGRISRRQILTLTSLALLLGLGQELGRLQQPIAQRSPGLAAAASPEASPRAQR